MTQQDKIIKLEVELKKYCHVGDCPNYLTCPEDCRCQAKLGLDTAIAWRTAVLLGMLGDRLWRKKQNIVQGERLSIIAYSMIVAYHKSRYKYLNQLLLDALQLVTDLQSKQ